MPIASLLRPAVLDARRELQEQRARLRIQHDEGSPGLQLAARLTEVVDEVVVRIFDAALAEVGLRDKAGEIALIAHGGYGRRDLAPYSDLDLMLTPLPSAEKESVALAKRLSQDIVDSGLQLGFSIRTPKQACQNSWEDARVFTSLVESRLLAGSSGVYTKLMGNLRAGAQRRQKHLVKAVAEARMNERAKWGDTGYLLRPNVKRGRGALRDIQLVRWIGFACYGEAEPDQLARLGAISDDDLRALRRALTFLLRLRNEMHFESGKPNDILDRPTQMAIASRWNYPGDTGLLPVEQFMREYFNLTSEVRYASANLLDSVNTRSRLGSVAESLIAKKIGSVFRIGIWHLWAPADKLSEVAGNVDKILELLQIARHKNRRIDHTTWDAIRRTTPTRLQGDIQPPTAQRFMELMADPVELSSILRQMHELRVLEHFVPALAHARCLLQFNEYHKYTVDAHSIRAVQAVTDLRDDPSAIGNAYRQIDNPGLLHLTLLIHDLGKGFEEDHSELGRKIAMDVGTRLHLPIDDIRLMQTLIHKHLRLADVAHRHDLNSRQIIENFGREIGSLRTLQWLFVHTIADLTAVGPGVLTDWKRGLITELYHRTLDYLQHGKLPGDRDDELGALRSETEKQLVGDTPALIRRCLAELPATLLRGRTVAEVGSDLERIGPIAEEKPRTVAWGQFDVEANAVNYTIVNRQVGKPIGTFARATGALASQGLEILRAEINTIADSVAWDCFTACDINNAGDPGPARIVEICQTVVAAFDADEPLKPKFRRYWKAHADQNAAVAVLPTRVEFDNTTSPIYSVLSVFAYDRPGLLYDIARVLAQFEVVIHFAKIATHFDQAADIFYVSELNVTKIVDSGRQQQLREHLFDAIGVSGQEPAHR